MDTQGANDTMENVFTQTFSLQSRDCDFTGRWKPSEIFVTMQEMAAAHSAMLGAGYAYMRSKNLAFALTRAELHMERYPKMEEKITCRTWAAPIMKWMYPRYFLFESEDGERLGYAGTVWVLLDLNARKMVSPAALNVEIATAEMELPMRMPGRAAAPNGGETREYTPGYSEIDVNGHVNNTRYVSWICDALGAEYFIGRQISTLIVNYSHEILPGRPITLRWSSADGEFCMSGNHGEINHFTLSGRAE